MLRLRGGVKTTVTVALAAASRAEPAAAQPSVAEPTAAVAVTTTTLAQPDAS